MEKENLQIINKKEENRFEMNLGEKTALIQYKKNSDGALNLYHTEVPAEYEGKGVGSQLVKQTLEQIKAEGKKIVPSCPFVAVYIKRHPEYQTMVK